MPPFNAETMWYWLIALGLLVVLAFAGLIWILRILNREPEVPGPSEFEDVGDAGNAIFPFSEATVRIREGELEPPMSVPSSVALRKLRAGGPIPHLWITLYLAALNREGRLGEVVAADLLRFWLNGLMRRAEMLIALSELGDKTAIAELKLLATFPGGPSIDEARAVTWSRMQLRTETAAAVRQFRRLPPWRAMEVRRADSKAVAAAVYECDALVKLEAESPGILHEAGTSVEELLRVRREHLLRAYQEIMRDPANERGRGFGGALKVANELWEQSESPINVGVTAAEWKKFKAAVCRHEVSARITQLRAGRGSLADFDAIWDGIEKLGVPPEEFKTSHDELSALLPAVLCAEAGCAAEVHFRVADPLGVDTVIYRVMNRALHSSFDLRVPQDLWEALLPRIARSIGDVSTFLMAEAKAGSRVHAEQHELLQRELDIHSSLG